MTNNRIWIIKNGKTTEVKLYNSELLKMSGLTDMSTIYTDNHLSTELVDLTIRSIRFTPGGLIYIRYFPSCYIVTSLTIIDSQVTRINHIITENLGKAIQSINDNYSILVGAVL